MRQIPFVPNSDDGVHCVQAAFGMMLQYFRPDKSWDFTTLDEMTHRVGLKGTQWFPVVTELEKLGLEVLLIEHFDYQRFYTEGSAYMYELYDKEVADWYLEKSNLLDVRDLIPEFLSQGTYENRAAELADLERLLAEGWLVGLDVNSRLLNGKEGFSSHMVVVFDSDNDEFILHDPGDPPLADRRVSKDLLIRAWEYAGADNKGLIAIRGSTSQNLSNIDAVASASD